MRFYTQLLRPRVGDFHFERADACDQFAFEDIQQTLDTDGDALESGLTARLLADEVREICWPNRHF
jgi:hypothetical protein